MILLYSLVLTYKKSPIPDNYISKKHLLDLQHQGHHPASSNIFLSFYSLNFSCTGLWCTEDCDFYPSQYLNVMIFYQKNMNLNSWAWLFPSLHSALMLTYFFKDNTGLHILYKNLLPRLFSYRAFVSFLVLKISLFCIHVCLYYIIFISPF